jgi:hypothetical protein
MRQRRLIAAAIVLTVVLLAAIGYAFTNNLTSSSSSSSSIGDGNLLANGGFESGNLQGWQTGNLLVPTVESTVVNGSRYAASFVTTGNGLALSQCTLHALECSLLNSSTISQAVSRFSLSPSSRLSVAVFPSFQSPSVFQIALDFTPSSQRGSQDVIIYYIFYASSEQCDAYSQLLVNATQHARAFCLPAQQGEWNAVNRNISNDIPSALSPSYLTGASLTLSLSFAGGNSNDTAYVDSIYLG